MIFTVTDMAEAQAIGICWLFRRRGLPDIPNLRLAITNLHPDRCGYCDYPVDELMSLLERRQVSERAEKDWWAMPNRARSVAIRSAQGLDS